MKLKGLILFAALLHQAYSICMESDMWIMRQQKSFTRWVDQYLQRPQVDISEIQKETELIAKSAKKLCKAIYQDKPLRVIELIATSPAGIMHVLIKCSWWLDEKVSAVHVAAAENEECLALLLARGANANITSEEGNAPLHRVCSRNAVDLLLRCGANINQQNEQGKTPLFSWVEQQKEDAYALSLGEFLLKNGADMNIKDNEGTDSLNKADWTSCWRIASLLSGNDAIAIAKQEYDGNFVDLLQEDSYGRTLMDCAIAREDIVAINNALLSYFIHIMKVDGYYLAHGYYQQAQCVLKQLKDINARSKKGRTVLHKACHHVGHNNKRRYITLLLSAGADYTMCDDQGRTCLFDILNAECKKACRSLLKTVCCKMDDRQKFLEWLNATDHEGKSALYCAAVESSIGRIVPILLEYGACVKQKMMDDCKEDWMREILQKEYDNDMGR